MTDEPEYPDAEASRLLGLLAETWRVPEGETYAQRAERVRRCTELEDALYSLGSSPGATGIPKPEPTAIDLPLLGVPAWGTSFRVAADDLVAQAVEDAHAALDANPRATGPHIVARRVLDHHFARGEHLPPRAWELLGRALRLEAKSIVAAMRRARIAAADAAGTGTKAIAAELGIGERAVRALRSKPVEQSDAMVHLLALQDQPPRRSTRDAIARLLGPHEKQGRWPNEMREGARAEAQRRIEAQRRADDMLREAGRQNDAAAVIKATDMARALLRKARNDALAVAGAMDADVRKVERWMARPNWEWAVVEEVLNLRGAPPADPHHIIDYDRDRGEHRVMTRDESREMRKASMRNHRAG
jgi:hypothetical protein